MCKKKECNIIKPNGIKCKHIVGGHKCKFCYLFNAVVNKYIPVEKKIETKVKCEHDKDKKTCFLCNNIKVRSAKIKLGKPCRCKARENSEYCGNHTNYKN